MINTQNISTANKTPVPKFNKPESSIVRYGAVKEHLCCDLNGNAVLLSLKSGKYFGVNAVGSFIWSIIQTPCSLEEINRSVMDEYEVDAATCRKEVRTFLTKMIAQDLINVSDEDAD